MKFHARLAAVTCLAAPLLAQAAPTIEIDSFSDAKPGLYPFSLTSVSGPFTLGVDSPITGAIGGGRVLGLQAQTMDIPGLDSVTTRVFTGGPGVLDFDSSSGADGLVLAIYGNFQNFLPALNIAIPAGSYAKIDLVAFDLPAGGSLLANVQVENTGTGVEATSTVITTAGAQSILIPLDAISAAVRGNVTNLVFGFNGTKATDFRIDNISIVVPEPASFGLLAPAGLLLARRRRA